MRVINAASNITLANQVEMAEGLLARMKGLLGRKALGAGAGMCIKPCTGIHTFGMKFPIDVIFLDTDNKVLAVHGNLRPNHMTPVRLDAASVLELPAGVIESTSTAVGDTLEFS